ncbi:MAG: FAD-dependent 5-carboxymethylaminomethyl-2-thiouridine(34) oxidoreductase MnmC [Marinobacter sp.]|uniref:FAD-dependent 5-carboxymethylaminomethyl-2-thiouridine(34) oxidoreductase MnmC n=1 Tax=Marinobacter sp. TaxID=50741 RepID=UPI003F980E94
MSLPTAPPAIEPAEPSWGKDTAEFKSFGRQYGCSKKELEDFRHGFIEHNSLPARFSSVPEAGSFVVAEAGFGSGLNFLATWQAWQAWKPDHAATLHFVASERAPLTLQALKSALSIWPEFQDLANELIASYPPLVHGAHRIVLAEGTVRLTLFFGESNDAWDTLTFKADAWILNGFEPTLAPEIWQKTATKEAIQHKQPDTSGSQAPSVAVIGAGIAGCLLANNLARRGHRVTLIDAADEPGSAASGNLQGAMYVKLGVEFNHQTQLALSALTFSQRYYARYTDQFWHPTGLIQLAWSNKEQSRQRRFTERNQYPEELLRSVTRHEAETLAGAKLPCGGLWFPGCGWLEPNKLCKSLALQPGIKQVFGYAVNQLEPFDGHWCVSGAAPHNSDIHADQVVICAGHLTPELIPGPGSFRFKAIRGQVTYLPDPLIAQPRAVICGARYLNPVHNAQGENLAVVGATFDLHSKETATTIESHRENIQAVSSMVPDIISQNLANDGLPDQLEGRVGFRCTTHDYQPVAGVLSDTQGQNIEGLYLLTGMGSKGLTYAPVLAEFVADQLTGQPQALPATLAKRLATGRMRQRKTDAS